MSECQHSKYGMCCCTCKHRLDDHSHPCTDGKSIMEHRGYICRPPESDGRAFSGWSEHGLCEMHEERK